MCSTWVVTIEEDTETGEIFVPIPEQIMSAQGWAEGDTLTWVDNYDGSWTISKVS